MIEIERLMVCTNGTFENTREATKKEIEICEAALNIFASRMADIEGKNTFIDECISDLQTVAALIEWEKDMLQKQKTKGSP